MVSRKPSEQPGDADLWPPGESLPGLGFIDTKTPSPPFSNVGWVGEEGLKSCASTPGGTEGQGTPSDISPAASCICASLNPRPGLGLESPRANRAMS